jgi:hypothetical protein
VQLLQSVTLVFASEPEYLPAAQLVQASLFVSASLPEYLPAVQLLQSLALVFACEPEYLPAAQSVQTEAPATEYFPATHDRHAPVPAAFLPVPLSYLRSKQVRPSAPMETTMMCVLHAHECRRSLTGATWLSR